VKILKSKTETFRVSVIHSEIDPDASQIQGYTPAAILSSFVVWYDVCTCVCVCVCVCVCYTTTKAIPLETVR